MNKQHLGKLSSGSPSAGVQAVRGLLPEGDWERQQTLLELRFTAQQVDKAVAAWMTDTVGSVARYQILLALWAANADGIPHADLLARMGITRGAFSGLMSALEAEGYVQSTVDRRDYRRLIARMTEKGEAATQKAFDTNAARLGEIAFLTTSELAIFATLLHRIREAFAKPR